MQKETFRLKNQLSQPRGLSNRGLARCPFDDEEAENFLIRDLLLTLATVLVLSAGGLATGVSVHILVSKLALLSLCMNHFLIASCVVLTVAVSTTLICSFVYLCGVLHHRDPEVYAFTLAIMSVFTALLAASSGTMASISRAKIVLRTTSVAYQNTTSVHLLDSYYKTELVAVLTTSMMRYKSEQRVQATWDALQIAYNCCGVNNATDWLKSQGVIPMSCCSSLFCSGCLDPVAVDVATVSSSTAATSFILAVVMLVSSVVSGWLWKSGGQKPPLRSAYSIEMVPMTTSPSNEIHRCFSVQSNHSSDSDSDKEEEMLVRYYNTGRQ